MQYADWLFFPQYYMNKKQTHDASSTDWLRQYGVCENYTDEEAILITHSLETLAILLLEIISP
jgi:predicted alpha/beta hydrolase family esterase